jgi:hypothetical protein
MFRGERFLFDRQGAPEEGFGHLMVPLILGELSQAIKGDGCGRVVRRKDFLVDRQGALEEGFGHLRAPLSPVEPCQVMEGGGGVGMVRWKGFLFDRQGAPNEGFGLLVALRWLLRISVQKKHLESDRLFPFLCWLHGTSVHKIQAFLRTDAPRSQHSSFRLRPTPIKLTEVSELRTVLAPWSLRWRMMREKDEPKAPSRSRSETEEESPRSHGRECVSTPRPESQRRQEAPKGTSKRSNHTRKMKK